MVLVSKEEDGPQIFHRILWLGKHEDLLVMIDLLPDRKLRAPYFVSLSDIYLKISDGTFVRAAFELPRRMLMTDADLRQHFRTESIAQAYIDKRDQRWKLIAPLLNAEEPYIYHHATRSALLKEIAQEHKTVLQVPWRFLKIAYKYGRIPNALLDKYEFCGSSPSPQKVDDDSPKRGRPSDKVATGHATKKTGINVTESVLEKMMLGIDLFYKTDDKKPIAKAYQQTRDKFFVQVQVGPTGLIETVPMATHLVPTLGQFRYHANKKIRDADFRKKRIGDRKYNLTARSITGTAREDVIGPGHRYEIDATIADVFLISSFNAAWIIGRPVVYLVVDSASSFIVGLYVGLIGPSWEGARLAMINALSDKTEFLARYGIANGSEIWPAHHVPYEVVGDRGEMIGDDAGEALGSVGIPVANPGPFRADCKPVVERSFKIYKDDVIDWLPGAVLQRTNDMRKRPCLLDACLTIQEFTKIIINNVIQRNNHHQNRHLLTAKLIKHGVPPYSIDMFKWGLENLTQPRRVLDIDVVRTHFLPSDFASITPRGIIYNGLQYSCERAIAEQWYEKARSEGRWKVPIKREYTTGRIYLAPPLVSKYEACDLVDERERYQNRLIEEVLDRDKILQLQGSDLSDKDERASLALRNDSRNIIVGAKNRKNQQRKERVPKGKGIRENKEMEKTLERHAEARKASSTNVVNFPTKNEAVARKQAEPKPMDDLMALLAAHRNDTWEKSDDA